MDGASTLDTWIRRVADPSGSTWAHRKALLRRLLDDGEPLGEYAVEAVIGRGATSTVLRAAKGELRYAIKLFRHPMREGDAAYWRLAREVYVAQRLPDRATVKVYEVGVHEGFPYVVMELLEGETLGRRLREGPLHEGETKRILEPVVRVLSRAHRLGIVHRDLKPENLFLTCKPDSTRVLDFGLVKLLNPGAPQPPPDDDDWDGLTRDGEALGTPSYMPPEQFFDSRNASPRSDQYALAAVAFEMLAGQRVAVGENFPALYYAKQQAPELPASIPGRWRAALRRALQPRPMDRFSSVGEFFQAATG